MNRTRAQGVLWVSVETNADETEGHTAVWEFELWDAILRPAEIHVRSEIPF